MMEVPMDGQKVSYVGEDDASLAIGDEGKVLDGGTTGSHILWSTGARRGEVTLTNNWDLVINRRAVASYADDLDSGGLVSTAIRETYDQRGARGVVQALTVEGHLAAMTTLAEEAIVRLAGSIRLDPSMREVLALLDPEEASELVHLAAQAVLKDAFGSH